jgi:septal ring factor EnvC (AmiA/AmiB activator)
MMKCVNEFFAKPYNLTELLNCVHKYLKPAALSEASLAIDDLVNSPSDSSKNLEDLRQKIVTLRHEVSATGAKTAEAEETLQTLNKLIERIEARKRARDAIK